MKKIYQINIDNYDLIGKNDFIYEIYLMDKKYHKIVSDIMQIIHINLDYLRKLDYTKIIENQVMKNLYVFICGNDNLSDLIKNGDDFMKEIAKEVREISGFDDMNFYLTDEEILELDRQDIINEIRQEVKNEVRQEVKNEVRQEVKNEVRQEVKNEVRQEVKNEVKQEVKNEVRQEVEEKQQQLIKNLYINGISLELISKSTNLTINEIKKNIK